MATTYFEYGSGSTATSHQITSITNSSGDLIEITASIKVDEIDSASISDSQTLTWTESISDTGALSHNQRTWTAVGNGTTTSITISGWTTACHAAMVVAVDDTNDTVGNTGSTNASGSTKQISITYSSAQSGSLVISNHSANNDGANDPVVPTGFTDRATPNSAGISTARVSLATADIAGTGSAQNHTWDDNTAFLTDRNVGVIEIYTAAGGANPKGPLGMPFHGPFGGPI